MRSHDLRILVERRVQKRWPRRKERDYSKYYLDPVGYAVEVLKVTPTPDQATIASAFLTPPYKVKVRAGHNVGKTFMFAWLANWWYDTRLPGVVITTAPTKRDVIDLLWTEIRLQRANAGLPDEFPGPVAPELRSSQNHWAKGYTARKGESFQGRHRENMLFLFDEDEGIDPPYYQRTTTMFKQNAGHAWGSIGNPYTVTSQSYREEQLTNLAGEPEWNLFTLNAMEHPNIAAELAGEPIPVPNAIDCGQIASLVAANCDSIDAADRVGTDIEWPPGSGSWYRPGPIFEAGVLGRRPTVSIGAVWSEFWFKVAATRLVGTPATKRLLRWDPMDVPEIGNDVARFGDDWTCIHARRGPCSLFHESGNGWATTRTAGKVIIMARRLTEIFNADHPTREPLTPQQIPIKVDDDGIGGAVTDMLAEQKYNVIPVNAQTPSHSPRRYPSRRSELWYDVTGRAESNNLDFTRLPKTVIAKLQQQAMTPLTWVDSQGRRCVEEKKDTKRRLKGRSPDDMDAVNLAYAEQGAHQPAVILTNKRRDKR